MLELSRTASTSSTGKRSELLRVANRSEYGDSLKNRNLDGRSDHIQDDYFLHHGFKQQNLGRQCAGDLMQPQKKSEEQAIQCE